MCGCVQWQDVDTQGASDAEIVKLSSADSHHHHHHLLIVANSRSSAGLTRVMSTVHGWDSARRQFVSRQYIATQRAQTVRSLTVNSVHFVVFANTADSVTRTTEI